MLIKSHNDHTTFRVKSQEFISQTHDSNRYLVSRRRMGGEVDQNRHKQLQKGRAFPEKTKNTPWEPISLVLKGFYLFWAGYPNKKRDSLSTVSLVREAGLEPACPE